MPLLPDTSAPMIFLHFPSTLILLCSTCAVTGGHALLLNGEYPWTYDNDLFGGPDFWGLMHKHWRMCKLGALQSPINIDPTKLIFDPQLGKIRISQSHVEAELWNMGQFPLLTLATKNTTTTDTGGGGEKSREEQKQQQTVLNISGGPAHPYTYQIQQIVVHFGDVRRGERGSEHTIDRIRFPAELQILAFNSDLYDNFTQAQSQPRGLLGIAIIIDIGDRTNAELHRLSQATKHIKHRNQMVRIKRFQPAALVPPTEHYVTYDGSMTYPGCFETVTWLVFNSPIYISIEDLAQWGELVQSEAAESEAKTETGAPPPVPLSSNYRPLKASNGRALRTNINTRLKSVSDGGQCPSRMYVDMGYRTNPARTDTKVPSSPHSLSRQEKSADARTKREQGQLKLNRERITEEEGWMFGMEVTDQMDSDQMDRDQMDSDQMESDQMDSDQMESDQMDSDQEGEAENLLPKTGVNHHPNLAVNNCAVPSMAFDECSIL
ncbi:hypothetical protein niasHS_000398 [Heterodera schachtii]|uniref:Alpha-carbonic anhydrase domain-containing protein n=1 Tax=Heterodera schachtii TaxID=97005 RepID=A0ABD2KBJ1_HETSC